MSECSWPANMSGSRLVKKSAFLLLLFLLLLTTRTVKCQYELEEEDEANETQTLDLDFNETTTHLLPLDYGGTDEGYPDEIGSAEFPDNTTEEDAGETGATSLTEIILIPVVVVVLVIIMVAGGIFINRKWNNKVKSQELGQDDPYLYGSPTEKVPMPMFEDDVPSVLELEMDELGQWMKKDVEAPKDA